MGDEPEGQADDEADQHFHLQRDAASVFSHWPSSPRIFSLIGFARTVQLIRGLSTATRLRRRRKVRLSPVLRHRLAGRGFAPASRTGAAGAPPGPRWPTPPPAGTP